jgi:hypothetical protein
MTGDEHLWTPVDAAIQVSEADALALDSCAWLRDEEANRVHAECYVDEHGLPALIGVLHERDRLSPWRGLPGRIRVETRCALKPEDRGTDASLITGGFGVVLGVEAADLFGLAHAGGRVCSNHPASPAKHRHYGAAR